MLIVIAATAAALEAVLRPDAAHAARRWFAAPGSRSSCSSLLARHARAVRGARGRVAGSRRRSRSSTAADPLSAASVNGAGMAAAFLLGRLRDDAPGADRAS